MASTLELLDLDSLENRILLNPRWPQAELQKLTALAEKAQESQGLQGHVWIATSGSTTNDISETKIVALSKSALKASAQAVNAFLNSNSKDRWAQVLPAFHVGGLGIDIRASLVGASVQNGLRHGKWEPGHFYKMINDQGSTLSALVPTQVFDIVRQGFRSPSDMRAIIVGGGAMDRTLYKRARDLGWPVLPSYGMTEAGSQIATATLESLNSTGFPEITLLSHAKARANTEGFIEIQANSLFSCYAQLKDNQECIWSPQVNGWFTTEDRGQVNGTSLLIEGRSNDYVKIGGEGTNMARLRGMLEESVRAVKPEALLQVTLLDVPSERLGHEVHLVSTLSSVTSERIAQDYAHRVLPFEKVRQIHLVKEIPRSELGKILWQPLKNLCKLGS